MDNGWIKIHRKLLNWGWHSNPNTLSVFIHLLLLAAWKDGFYKGRKISRGQAVIGSKTFPLSIGISRQSLRTAINHLISTNEITIESTTQFTVVTISNYDAYQSEENDTNQPINQPINQQSTNDQPTINQRLTTSEEGNKVEECKNIILSPELPLSDASQDPAESIYAAYPRKANRQAALREIRKAIKRDGITLVTDKTKEYASMVESSGMDKQFVPYASKWYKEQRYLESFEQSSKTAPQSNGNVPRINHDVKTAQPTAFTLKTALDAIQEEIKQVKNRGFEDAMGWQPKSEEDRKALRELNGKRKEILTKMTNLGTL